MIQDHCIIFVNVALREIDYLRCIQVDILATTSIIATSKLMNINSDWYTRILKMNHYNKLDGNRVNTRIAKCGAKLTSLFS